MPRGRPKGSKNKPKNVVKTPEVEVDNYFSRIAEIGDKPIISNWNAKKGEYTSRMYGSLNDIIRVIEPDGVISLQGNNIIQSVDKKNVRTLTDGRKFDGMGWPVQIKSETIVEKKLKKGLAIAAL